MELESPVSCQNIASGGKRVQPLIATPIVARVCGGIRVYPS